MKQLSDRKLLLLNAQSKGKKDANPNIASNLRKLMELANISEHELSRRTNIKQPIIHRLLSGENQNPKLSTVKPIADYFTITISQLIGEQKMKKVWNGHTTREHHGWNEVPLINWEDVCKSKERKIQRYVVIDCNVSESAYALLIIDSSMEPVFPEKSLIIVDPIIKPIDGDFIILKMITNDIVVRQVHTMSDKTYCAPLNRRFGNIIEITPDDTILGSVIRTIYDHRIVDNDIR